MATLAESAVWVDGIYQLETTDLVLGGADGTDNIQAKQLGSRTLYLKEQVEALGEGKQPADPTLTAIAALVGSIDKIIYFTGGDTAALSSLTAFARTLLACADAAAVRGALSAVSQAELASAVAALVNSSPAALDTLKELADALGDDANFATTMTNALALKAALASPTFTGDPKAPTPAQFDNDISLATTAFVQRALGNFANCISYSANATLTPSQVGTWNAVTAGGVTLTLPLISACPIGAALTFYGNGSGLTVQRQGADQIVIGSSGAGNSVVIGAHDILTLINNGSTWYPVGGSAQLGASSAFASSVAGNGWQKLPSGLILQWGVATFTGATASVVFPLTFPTAVYSIVALSPNVTQPVTTSASTSAGCTLAIDASNPGASTYWIALGK